MLLLLKLSSHYLLHCLLICSFCLCSFNRDAPLINGHKKSPFFSFESYLKYSVQPETARAVGVAGQAKLCGSTLQDVRPSENEDLSRVGDGSSGNVITAAVERKQ